jgi:hypothetical protein
MKLARCKISGVRGYNREVSKFCLRNGRRKNILISPTKR